MWPPEDPELNNSTSLIVGHLVELLSGCKTASRYALTLRIALNRFRRSMNVPGAMESDPDEEAELDHILSQSLGTTPTDSTLTTLRYVC
jgi:hypothetical protein